MHSSISEHGLSSRKILAYLPSVHLKNYSPYTTFSKSLTLFNRSTLVIALLEPAISREDFKFLTSDLNFSFSASKALISLNNFLNRLKLIFIIMNLLTGFIIIEKSGLFHIKFFYYHFLMKEF